MKNALEDGAPCKILKLGFEPPWIHIKKNEQFYSYLLGLALLSDGE